MSGDSHNSLSGVVFGFPSEFFDLAMSRSMFLTLPFQPLSQSTPPVKVFLRDSGRLRVLLEVDVWVGGVELCLGLAEFSMVLSIETSIRLGLLGCFLVLFHV